MNSAAKSSSTKNTSTKGSNTKGPSAKRSTAKGLFVRYSLRRIQIMFTLLPAFFLSGCSGLQLINNLSKLQQADVHKDISFGEHPRLSYDLYLPPEKSENLQKTPVIVFFYGGSWNRGDKADYEFVGRRLAAQGYIVAIPNYRLYPEVRYPEFLTDAADAVKHLQLELSKPNYARLAPDHAFITMGHSAGAYNAAMLAFDASRLRPSSSTTQSKSNPDSSPASPPRPSPTKSDLTTAPSSPSERSPVTVRGFIGVAGPYNIYPINDPEVRPVFHHPEYRDNSMPIDFANQKQPPALILTPEEDVLINTKKNSTALCEALSKAGNTAKCQTITGTDHITIIGTLSPALFMKGSSTKPINEFIDSLYATTKSQ